MISWDRLKHLDKEVLKWLREDVQGALMDSFKSHLTRYEDTKGINDASKKLLASTDGEYWLVPIKKLIPCIFNVELYDEINQRSKGYVENGLGVDISFNGQYTPIVIFLDCGVVLSGHHRLLQALNMGCSHVPIVIAGLGKALIDILYDIDGPGKILELVTSYNAHAFRTWGEKFNQLERFEGRVNYFNRDKRPIEERESLEKQYDQMIHNLGMTPKDVEYLRALKHGGYIKDSKGKNHMCDPNPDLWKNCMSEDKKASPEQEYKKWEKNEKLALNAVSRPRTEQFDKLLNPYLLAETWLSIVDDYISDLKRTLNFKYRPGLKISKETNYTNLQVSNKLAASQEWALTGILCDEYPELEAEPRIGMEHYDIEFLKKKFTNFLKWAIECKITYKDISFTSNTPKYGYIQGFFYNPDNLYEVCAIYMYAKKGDWVLGGGNTNPQIPKKNIIKAVNDNRCWPMIGGWKRRGNGFSIWRADVRKLLSGKRMLTAQEAF